MLILPGSLQVRKRKDGARVIRGRFPYNKRAVLTDGGNKGRPVKEQFKPGAFTFRLNDPLAEIHLLFGHDYDRPLASKLNGTLSFKDTAKALLFEAVITAAVMRTSYAKDVLALVAAGLSVGLSPGFRIPPKQTVPNAETVEDEDPREGRAVIRTINDCLLYELSIVTAPAYPEATVETVEDEAPEDDEAEEEDEPEDEEAEEEAEARSINLAAYRWR